MNHVYMAPSSSATQVVLMASDRVWRNILASREVPHRLSTIISDDDKLWRSAAAKIAIVVDSGGRQVVMNREEAAMVIDMARSLP